MALKRTFQRGSGCYTCAACGKRTLDTGRDEAGVGLCIACYDAAGHENAHYDGHHAETPEPACPLCQQEGKTHDGIRDDTGSGPAGRPGGDDAAAAVPDGPGARSA